MKTVFVVFQFTSLFKHLFLFGCLRKTWQTGNQYNFTKMSKYLVEVMCNVFLTNRVVFLFSGFWLTKQVVLWDTCAIFYFLQGQLQFDVVELCNVAKTKKNEARQESEVKKLKIQLKQKQENLCKAAAHLGKCICALTRHIFKAICRQCHSLTVFFVFARSCIHSPVFFSFVTIIFELFLLCF